MRRTDAAVALLGAADRAGFVNVLSKIRFLLDFARIGQAAALRYSLTVRASRYRSPTDRRIGQLKILSVRQPWAALIVAGVKDVENRTWPTRYRGAVLVHASLRADDISSEDIERRYGVRLLAELPLGGIVGMTEIVDCVRPHPSRWYAPGHYAFVLASSRPLPFVKWKGALLLREAPAELLELLDLRRAGHPERQPADVRMSGTA